jgi:choloylglycine hydrolase
MRKLVVIALLVLLSASFVFACTEFLLSPEKNNGLVISGRSMEFAYPLDSKVVIRNRGETFSSHLPDGTESITWTSEYGYVGLNAFDMPNAISEGMNETGLSVSALWLPLTEYAKVSENDDKEKVIEILDLSGWILGNFKDLDNLRNELGKMIVWGEHNEIIDEIPPLHLSLHDRKGGSLVVEFIDGEMNFYDNPNGVLTNAPELPWHLTNLRNFVNLSPYMKEATINGKKYKGMGFGSGYVGMPGDGTPPSRFIRTSLYKEFVNPVETHEEGVMLALHLLNTVDIPTGASKREGNSQASFENTQWVTIKDHQEMKFYFRSYNSPSLYLVDLNKIDFSKGTLHKEIPVDQGFEVIEVQ